MNHVHILRRLASVRFVTLVFIACFHLGLDAVAEEPPEERWVNFWNGPANSSDYGLLVAHDPEGSIYVAGTTYEGGTGGHLDDIFLLRLDDEGNEVWSMSWGGPLGTNDGVDDVAVAGNGNVVLTGHGWNPPQAEDAITILYRQSSGEIIFADDFESGDPDAWSSVSP